MTIYLLVGEMGVGKTTIGKLLAEKKGLPFYDGDTALPKKFANKVAKGLPLSVDETDEFVYADLVPFARQAAVETRNSGLVFAQALYDWKHRKRIAEVLCSAHDDNSSSLPYGRRPGKDLRVVRIIPDSLLAHFKNLRNRKHWIRWTLSCLASKPWFEHFGCTDTIVNKADPQAVVDRECGKWGVFAD